MKSYYVTSLVISKDGKQNLVDKIQAKDRDEAKNVTFDKYTNLGFEVIKQRIIEL